MIGEESKYENKEKEGLDDKRQSYENYNLSV